MQPNPEPLRVLIVDDSPSMRAGLRALLSGKGYNVVGECTDGAEVAANLSALSPDIVCLDLHMPKMDGMTVLTNLHGDHPDLAFVMMTGDQNPETRHKATRAGAAGFLKKPFSPKQILEELGHVTAAIHLLRKEARPDEVAEFDFDRPRAVIAEDSATARRLLRIILENQGIAVVAEAVDGAQAIQLAMRENPDLMCMDIEMPVMNGLDAMAQIRTRLPNLPILMVSSSADRDTVRQAVRGGARGYIIKPYQAEKVAEALSALLKR